MSLQMAEQWHGGEGIGRERIGRFCGHCRSKGGTAGLLRLGLIGFGVYQVAIGLFQIAAPGVFFDLLGPFGPRNEHYVLDVAAFELPLGAMLLAAVRLQSWRVPALAFATGHWALHALNHLVDIGAADPRWVGVFDFFALTAGAVALGWLLSHALRAERWSAGP
jgi:hypothetical protein